MFKPNNPEQGETKGETSKDAKLSLDVLEVVKVILVKKIIKPNHQVKALHNFFATCSS